MAISGVLRSALDQAANIWIPDDAGDNKSDSPDFRSDLWKRQQADMTLVRHVTAGTRAMREAGTTYMPMRENETPDQYRSRLKLAVLFNAVSRTIDGLAGMLFRKDPVADVHARILPHLDNVDLAGTDLASWAKRQTWDALRDGHVAVHVEFPDTSTAQSRADELRPEIRPYWIPIAKDNLINLRWELVGGQPVITLAVYAYTEQEPDGMFGETLVERRRVLRPGEWQVYTQNDKGDWDETDAGRGPDVVPLVPLYATQPVGMFETVPPLLDLAYENVGHWQIRNSRRWTLEVAGIPLAVFVGRDTDELLEWGPFVALDLEGDNAQAFFLEVEGKSLSEMRQEVLDIEARMAALGLSMLVRETRSAETAEAKRMDRAEGDSKLATTAAGVENGLNEVLGLHGAYMNIAEPGSVTINRDYMAAVMDAQMVAALSAEVIQGHLRLEDLLNALKAGEILPDSYDVDEAVADLDEATSLDMGEG